MESLLSNPKPSTYKTISSPEDKAALEEKIRATMGSKALPQPDTSKVQEQIGANENFGKLPAVGTTGGGKKGLASALAQQAVQNSAQETGVPKKSLREETMDILKDLKSMNAKDYQAMNDAIEGQKGEADRIKSKGLSEALMQFGFGMAANAAKPGSRQGLSGILGSAAAAAPVIGQVASENEKLQRAAKDNYMKLRMDQTRYQVALDKGDMQTATALASQIRQSDMQQKQLDALVDYHNKQLQVERQKLGVTAAAYAPQAIREAEMLMSHTPGMTFQDAYKQATRGRDASENAAGARDRAALARGLMDLNKQQKTEKMMYPPNTPEGKKLAIEHDMQRKLLHESLGFQYTGGATPTANSNIKVLP
jgi:hypothetical protein